jgi:hypothetical protein
LDYQSRFFDELPLAARERKPIDKRIDDMKTNRWQLLIKESSIWNRNKSLLAFDDESIAQGIWPLIRSNFIKTTYDISLDSQIYFFWTIRTRLPTLVSWIHNAGTDNISKEEEKYSSQEKHQETSEDDQWRPTGTRIRNKTTTRQQFVMKTETRKSKIELKHNKIEFINLEISL